MDGIKRVGEKRAEAMREVCVMVKKAVHILDQPTLVQQYATPSKGRQKKPSVIRLSKIPTKLI